MIYEVYLDDELLFYPNDETYSVIDAKLETSLNEAGFFECYVPASNLRYEGLNNKLRSGMIRVMKDNVEIFNGEIREVKQCFDFTKYLYAVGELAFLFDSIQPQAVYHGTPVSMFHQMIAYHNSQVEDRKKFSAGNVTVTDANDYIYHYTNREDTLTDLREKLCNTLDGYLRIRKAGNTRYLDLVRLEDYGSYCLQEIQFGENLLDYSCNYTANDIATCVIPLGTKLDDDQRTADAVEGLDEYLTIKGTSVDSYHAHVNDDYVYLQSAVNQFGWVRVVKTWDDVTVKANLKTKAEEWLTSAQYSRMELELNAVDLNLLDNNIESFEVGDTIHAWAEPYEMDTVFPVRKKTVYLNDLSKNYIILSNTEVSKSYTKQNSDAVNQIKEEIPQTSPLLEEARKKALAMLIDETQGGHVVYEYHYNEDNEAEYIEAINICNAPSIEASTRRWRWSQNGLGFLSRKTTSQPWPTSDIPIAITNDGKINAEQILTGYLVADRIRGGSLSLGGKDLTYQNGALYMYDDHDRIIGLWNRTGITMWDISGNIIGQWTPSGINIEKGTITIGNFSVNADGKLTCTGADVSGTITASQGTIAGFVLSSDGFSKQGSGSALAKFDSSHIGISKACNGGYGTFKAEPAKGRAWVNTANEGGGGFYVCNGGGDTDDPKDGGWVRISPTGITRSDGGYIEWKYD